MAKGKRYWTESLCRRCRWWRGGCEGPGVPEFLTAADLCGDWSLENREALVEVHRQERGNVVACTEFDLGLTTDEH